MSVRHEFICCWALQTDSISGACSAFSTSTISWWKSLYSHVILYTVTYMQSCACILPLWFLTILNVHKKQCWSFTAFLVGKFWTPSTGWGKLFSNFLSKRGSYPDIFYLGNGRTKMVKNCLKCRNISSCKAKKVKK